MTLTIQRLLERPADRLAQLVAESESLQFRLVRRLVDEWNAGANRFDGPGEGLFAADDDGQIVGICGLNVDPFTFEPRVGRVRHLYVLKAYRRGGIGRRLVDEIISSARESFDRLRLRAFALEAAALYERLGFERCSAAKDYTHVLELRSARDTACH
jgi:GNAT superfamily N-acetyltransferase